MPAGPIAQWRRATLEQALIVHIIVNLSESVWDATVTEDTVTWTTAYLVTNLLIEAFFIWRLWAAGRIAWWIGLVLQIIGLVLIPVQATNPAMLGYPADTHPVEMLPLLLLCAVGIAAWTAPNVRRHVRALVPAGSRD